MMTVSRFAVALLLGVSSVNAFWIIECTIPIMNARVDPIVVPGKPSGHQHTIMGSDAIGYNTTFHDLRNSQCSTCPINGDNSAYWIPELYYQYKNGSFQAVDHGGMAIYYLQRGGRNETNYETVQAWPDGIRVLSGDPFRRNCSDPVLSQAISWACLADAPQAATPGLEDVVCPYGLRAQIHLPGCWDGVNLDSPDHKSHMAFPAGVDNGFCPPSHPVHLITIFYEVLFSVDPFNKLNDGGRFVLANGDPTGCGLHADFMNGWDNSVLSRAVATCTSGTGKVEDCPVFANENRIIPNDVANKCSARNPMPQEVVAQGSLLENLPGCVAVTEGPGPASPEDHVPGCVPGSVGGSGSVNGTSTPTDPSSVENVHRDNSTADECEGHHHHHHHHHCHDGPDATSDSAQPTSSTTTRRRHHVNRGHGSPILF